jgi:ATP-dependent DNA helicase RecQ
MLQRARAILKKHFGYSSFKKGQEQIIESILQGRDTLGIMPTGGGKSVCYQLPALLFQGLTLVISPLISLMKDQVDALDSLGIPGTFINSSLSFAEVEGRIKAGISPVC